MTRTAIIAGQGALPGLLAAAMTARGEDFVIAEMEGFAASVKAPTLPFRIERLVPFLDHLADLSVDRVVFAGAIRRPRIEAELIDHRTATLVPRLIAAMGKGDDAALREVISIFEEWDFSVVGADHIAPDLVPGAGVLVGTPTEADRRDAARGAEIVAALGPLDIGQGAVVAQGLCLAVETLPGTDAMLAFVAAHAPTFRPDPKGAGGVFYKAPKPGQDRRIDLPAIGVETVRRAAAAGLAGIAWEAGGVILLDRKSVEDAAEAAGLFLWAREP
ncbi:MAG: UDP-2,3-diacylglucosamine diphosphatase LpxI [Rhodobacteraceae bacterium]|nr:UDP-2,3-diacylglucosamine diphosphatase LpxI [Paracoccaceae bacterium]